MTRPATTRWRDLPRLIGCIARASRQKPPQDTGAAFHAWISEMQMRYGSRNLVLNLLAKKILLVGEPALSRQILAPEPGANGLRASRLKTDAMGFLAPLALTIRHGEDWRRLRSFNEAVLCTGRAHDFAQTFVTRVHAAFAHTPRHADDVRAAMGQAMLDIVFGEGVAPPELADEIRVLFDVVRSPLKRKLAGFRYRPRVRDFYSTLDDCRARSAEDSLLGVARRTQTAADRESLEQVPHWMFTFTGSGSDLLLRTLGMIASRPDARALIAAELARAGSPAEAPALAQMRYTTACLRETGRLWPPVTTSFHCATRDLDIDGLHIPAGRDILHYLPALHRSGGNEATARFEPGSWLGDSTDAPYSLLFLDGARACPGQDLIILACTAALARLTAESRLPRGAPALAQDPLPLDFPGSALVWDPGADV